MQSPELCQKSSSYLPGKPLPLPPPLLPGIIPKVKISLSSLLKGLFQEL